MVRYLHYFHVEIGSGRKSSRANSQFVRFHKKTMPMTSIMILFLISTTTTHGNLFWSSKPYVKIDEDADANAVTGALAVGCPAPAWDETGSTDYNGGDLVAHTDGNIYSCKNRKRCDKADHIPGVDHRAWKFVRPCITEAPTDVPSEAPTAIPSDRPSGLPTATPSSEPSLSPSLTPSFAPSWSCDVVNWVGGTDYKEGDQVVHDEIIYECRNKKRCDKSKFIPGVDKRAWQTIRRCITDSPSRMPSSSPTASVFPTRYPTEYPSKSPTSSPMIPTTMPTDYPTDLPTESPTDLPTQSPVESPTSSPTFSPTGSPTQSPTNVPTQSPVEFFTESPTKSPMGSPTDFPAELPTGPPTHQPTGAPTGSPSTESPTMSSLPTTTSQKPSFSLVPSASPSTSETPSKSDDKVSYTYVGDGNCLDERGEWYDWLLVSGAQTAKDCARVCTNSIGINSKFQLVGFEYGDRCNCLYTDGGLPDPILSEGIGYDGNGDGIHEVANSTGSTELYACYSNDLFTSSVEGFSFIGIGFCEDENSEYYDYIGKDDMTSIQDCGNYCTSVPQDFSKLVGFEFSLSSNYCYCLYTDGRLPTPIPNDVSSYSGFEGLGRIMDTAGSGSYNCYANDSFNLSDAIDQYTYIGDGFCRSGSNKSYNYYSRNTSSYLLCSDWCFTTQGESRDFFVGFQHLDSNRCDCLYVNGTKPRLPDGASLFDFSNAGEGKIMGVLENNNTVCYEITSPSMYQYCSPMGDELSPYDLTTILISEKEVGFGNSVGISSDGKHAIIGAPDSGRTYFSEDIYGYGSAFIFELHEDGSCVSPVMIVPPDELVFNELDSSSPGSVFDLGQAVAIEGDMALVFMEADFKDFGRVGTILVYRRNTDNYWKYEKMISGIDVNATEPDYFGRQMDLSGEVAIIGGYKEVFIYSFADDVANPFSRLIPSDGFIYSDYYYKFVSISGDLAIYGSDGEEAAYIFRKQSNGEWLEEAKLEPSAEMLNYDDYFGTSVSIHGDVAIVGSYRDSDAYIYRRNISGKWLLEAQLPCPDDNDNFGSAVDINGKYAIVGDYDYYYGEVDDSGIAYIYREEGGIWSLEYSITGTGEESYFGSSIAMSQSVFVIGGDDYYYDEVILGRFHPDAAIPSSSPSFSVVPTTTVVPSIAPTYTMNPSTAPSSSPSFVPTSSPAPSKGMSKRRRGTKVVTSQKEPTVKRSDIGGMSKGSERIGIHHKK